MTFKKRSPSESLDEFLLKKINPKSDNSDFLKNEYGKRICNIVKREQIAESLLLSIYTQIIKQGLLSKSLIDSSTDVLIAPVGENNYALLLIGRKLDFLAGKTIKQVLDPADVEKSYFSWAQCLRQHKAKSNDFYSLCCESYSLNDIVNAVDGNFAIKFTKEYDLIIVTLETPGYSSTDCKTPMPFLAISIDGATKLGVVGVLAENNDDQFGATLAYSTVSSHVVAGGRDIFINKYPATIISESQITDSCFAIFKDQTLARTDLILMTRPNNGPWRGKTPCRSQLAMFNETVSPDREKIIIRAWDPKIPFDFDDAQLKLVTDADVNLGAPGAPIFDEGDCIMGFASYRTKLGHNPSFCTWIWAESVFRAHNLVRSRSRSC